MSKTAEKPPRTKLRTLLLLTRIVVAVVLVLIAAAMIAGRIIDSREAKKEEEEQRIAAEEIASRNSEGFPDKLAFNDLGNFRSKTYPVVAEDADIKDIETRLASIAECDEVWSLPNAAPGEITGDPNAIECASDSVIESQYPDYAAIDKPLGSTSEGLYVVAWFPDSASSHESDVLSAHEDAEFWSGNEAVYLASGHFAVIASSDGVAQTVLQRLQSAAPQTAGASSSQPAPPPTQPAGDQGGDTALDGTSKRTSPAEKSATVIPYETAPEAEYDGSLGYTYVAAFPMDEADSGEKLMDQMAVDSVCTESVYHEGPSTDEYYSIKCEVQPEDEGLPTVVTIYFYNDPSAAFNVTYLHEGDGLICDATGHFAACSTDERGTRAVLDFLARNAL